MNNDIPLDVHFNGNKDVLTYNISVIYTNTAIIKRQILFIIAQMYDPLRLRAPVIIIFKIIIRKL